MNPRLPLLSGIALALLASVAGAGPTVSPEAKPLVDQMSSAYSGLHSLSLSGSLSADLDVAGQQQKHNSPFTASFQAPNRFRHETKGDLATGSTGQKLFLYSAQDNVYGTADAPNARPASTDLPAPILANLQQQDPSLLLALVSDPAAAFTAGAADIRTAEPVTLDGAAFDTLVLTHGSDQPSARVLVDRKTHLIRQVQVDLKPDLQRRGAPDVKKAIYTIDYAQTAPDAAIPANAFAWSAPQGAREKSLSAEDDTPDAVKALVGKPAPDFTLPKLDGGEVHLKDLKGQVVVLDFWATWCGPCVEGLPHVDAIYKDKRGAGLTAFAVNMQETPDKVKPFIQNHKLSLPVLLESKGDVAEKYKVEGIPETVVIGKDGNIRKIFVGTGPDTEQQLRAAVEEALKG